MPSDKKVKKAKPHPEMKSVCLFDIEIDRISTRLKQLDLSRTLQIHKGFL